MSKFGKGWILPLVSIFLAALLLQGCRAGRSSTVGDEPPPDQPDTIVSGKTLKGHPILFAIGQDGAPTSSLPGQGYVLSPDGDYGLWGYVGLSKYYGKDLFKAVQFLDGKQYHYLPEGRTCPSADQRTFAPVAVYQGPEDRVHVIGGQLRDGEGPDTDMVYLWLTDTGHGPDDVNYYNECYMYTSYSVGLDSALAAFYTGSGYDSWIVGYALSLDRGTAYGGVDAVVTNDINAKTWVHLPGEGNDYAVDTVEGPDGLRAVVGHTTSSVRGVFTRDTAGDDPDNSAHNTDHYLAVFDGNQLTDVQTRGEEGYNNYAVAVAASTVSGDPYFTYVVHRQSEDGESDVRVHVYEYSASGSWREHYWHTVDGSGYDRPTDVVVVDGNDIYIVGETDTDGGDFGPGSGDGNLDAFVMKIVADLSPASGVPDVWTTTTYRLKGSGDDVADSIFYDADDETLHVCGTTTSTDHDFAKNSNAAGSAWKMELPLDAFE